MRGADFSGQCDHGLAAIGVSSQEVEIRRQAFWWGSSFSSRAWLSPLAILQKAIAGCRTVEGGHRPLAREYILQLAMKHGGR